MTLDELLLQKLAEWRPDKGRQTLDVADAGSGWKAALATDCSDQVGCRVWELSLRHDKSSADLRAWADRVAARTTGLLESLKLLELDSAQDTALLRSQAPARRGEALYYYEVLLHGRGEARVRRYQATRNGTKGREQIPFALTHEALAKLVHDLTAEA
ncbi:MAG: hypothetical protein HYS12_03150 [Planctomycetes bacterium]|nr:hypothetical protein [Planctomycetota bacterium]